MIHPRLIADEVEALRAIWMSATTEALVRCVSGMARRWLVLPSWTLGPRADLFVLTRRTPRRAGLVPRVSTIPIWWSLRQERFVGGFRPRASRAPRPRSRIYANKALPAARRSAVTRSPGGWVPE